MKLFIGIKIDFALNNLQGWYAINSNKAQFQIDDWKCKKLIVIPFI